MKKKLKSIEIIFLILTILFLLAFLTSVVLYFVNSSDIKVQGIDLAFAGIFSGISTSFGIAFIVDFDKEMELEEIKKYGQGNESSKEK